MLHLKPGVNPQAMVPQVNLLIQIVSSIFAKHGQDCQVTSLHDRDPNRLVDSLHGRDGLCRAVDFKTTHLPDDLKPVILAEVRAAVGYGNPKPRAFDFIYEERITRPDGSIAKEEHYHGEYDPKFPVTKEA